MSKARSAIRIAAGTYRYRGCIVTLDHESETYQGWWNVYDEQTDSWDNEGDYFPTKRAAMAVIDADPPAGF